MIKVYILDDHTLIREGLKNLINDEFGFETIGESNNPSEVFSFLNENECDILILDISFPNISGLDVLKDLKIQFPELKILILSMHSEDQYALRSIKAGASGYLNKESASEELIIALHRIADGRRYLSDHLTEKLAVDIDDMRKPPHELLSDREFQILRMLAQGLIPKEIAGKLNIGSTTISTYRTRILRKLNLKSNADIIRYAFQHNLVE